MKSFFLSGVLSVLLLACSSKKSKGIVIVPLSETGFKMDSLAQGTKLRIIAWSGGLEDNKERTYLHQFIVIDKNTGDTLRVLARMLSVMDGTGKEVYSPISAFDADKNILDAEFRRTPEQEGIYDAIAIGSKEDGTPSTEEIMKAINDSSSLQKFVVMNYNFDIFTRPFKTVTGVLYFEQQPW